MAKAATMAELMAKSSPQVRSFKKGETIEGTITKLTTPEILVDIGAKTEAVVLEKDKNILHSLLSGLKVGDKVSVGILNPESDQGNPVVSLRKFIGQRQWGALEDLRNDETPLEVIVNDLTKGGFLVTTSDGTAGFLPNSQMTLNDNPASFMGKKITVVILELNKLLHKIIFSQKAAMNDTEFEKLTKNVKTGEIVDVVVSNMTPFGIFVSLRSGDANLEGFIHLSELSWDRIESAENFYKSGESIKAEVLGVDTDSKRVNLSVKRLTQDPFEEAVKEFSLDKKVTGKISKISSIGVTIDLKEGVSGLIKKEKLPPSSKYSVGDEVEVTVSEIDPKRHRLILSPVLTEKPIGYR